MTDGVVEFYFLEGKHLLYIFALFLELSFIFMLTVLTFFSVTVQVLVSRRHHHFTMEPNV